MKWIWLPNIELAQRERGCFREKAWDPRKKITNCKKKIQSRLKKYAKPHICVVLKVSHHTNWLHWIAPLNSSTWHCWWPVADIRPLWATFKIYFCPLVNLIFHIFSDQYLSQISKKLTQYTFFKSTSFVEISAKHFLKIIFFSRWPNARVVGKKNCRGFSWQGAFPTT